MPARLKATAGVPRSGRSAAYGGGTAEVEGDAEAEAEGASARTPAATARITLAVRVLRNQ
ncbi:hypothetical protein ACFQ0B_47725 [Nonomuraea thailandensis]